ncbi:DNA-J related domain-containing protein [Idiomarina seosinensis]|uniref:Molecular chaperone DnaJ n=1 Tax=Idiomarina seosinensis TaxID=281739 RepID=A0A432ZIU0_9GAMM|nr:DNA-J related domain-containing protein [Idiomarina seosinensis]RUO77945.1 molecular chaperone DnaJ [Idiomarina seosinensis]
MDEDIQILCAALSELLKSQPQWTEHQLIEQLKQPPYQLFDEQALRDPLSLFRTHFLIFHCLYRLQAEWRNQQIAELEIHTLAIKKLTWQPGIEGLQARDPLASYYLDLTQLTDTSKVDVEQLLNDFWDSMGQTNAVKKTAMPYQQACQTMQLTPPVSKHSLKRQYRRLIHKHHPDKGGSLRKMQTVKAAYQVLVNHL